MNSCIINSSNRKLTLLEEEELRFGLQYHILPNKVFENSIKGNVEKLAYALQTKYAVH